MLKEMGGSALHTARSRMAMKKSWLMGIVLVAIAGVAIAAAVPDTRYRLLAWISKERLINNRPIAYWLDALKDKDPTARRQAALSLGDADVCEDEPKPDPACQEVVAALATTLGDRDGFVRKCAATSFLIYPREMRIAQKSELATGLTVVLHDPEVVVRKAAARALWQLNPPLK